MVARTGDRPRPAAARAEVIGLGTTAHRSLFLANSSGPIETAVSGHGRVWNALRALGYRCGIEPMKRLRVFGALLVCGAYGQIRGRVLDWATLKICRLERTRDRWETIAPCSLRTRWPEVLHIGCGECRTWLLCSKRMTGVRKTGIMNTSEQRHSMCLKCFRKQWPHGKYSSWQVPVSARTWEVCCFCLKKHKDGIHKPRGRNSSDLECGGVHENSK